MIRSFSSPLDDEEWNSLSDGEWTETSILNAIDYTSFEDAESNNC